MTPYETIRLVASTLNSGQSERGECPWCRGGQSREHSFIITRDGGDAKYYCHRASCESTSRGVLSISGAPRALPPVKTKPASREFNGDTRSPSKPMIGWLYQKYGIHADMVKEYRLKETDEGKLVIPIHNSVGMQQGLEVKRGKDYVSGPKSLLYHGHESDGLNWFIGKPSYHDGDVFYSETLVLVEDALSAMKANAFCDSVCLHGVNLNPERAAHIASMGYERVFVALDADAKARAFSMVRRYRAMIPHIQVMLLEKDIKDMHWDSIASLLAFNHRRIL